ncbi:hypothetical protein CTEN210_05586 [Chaetoceros tenuissimus]|uniref:Uncharacterized protein n=1 Tax=Chaetoceros tenuissimus TaxID=426638 RepID=A0AAD3CQR5_9STRA|nr:hypothetical protein CTEN210_05586 [Chaetoceros tenuissimus]
MTSNQQFKSSFSPDGSNNNRRIRFADDERTSGSPYNTPNYERNSSRYSHGTNNYNEENYRQDIFVTDNVEKAKKSFSFWMFVFKMITLFLLLIAAACCYLSSLSVEEQQVLLEQVKEIAIKVMKKGLEIATVLAQYTYTGIVVAMKYMIPSKSSEYLAVGQSLLKSNDPAGAESLCLLAHDEDPTNVSALICLGEARLALHNSAWSTGIVDDENYGLIMEKLKSAKSTFEAAVKLKNGVTSPDVRLGLGLSLYLSATRSMNVTGKQMSSSLLLGSPIGHESDSNSQLLSDSILHLNAAASLTHPKLLSLSLKSDPEMTEKRKNMHIAAKYNSALAHLALGDMSPPISLFQDISSSLRESGVDEQSLILPDINSVAIAVQRGVQDKQMKDLENIANVCSKRLEFDNEDDEIHTQKMCAILYNNLAVARESRNGESTQPLLSDGKYDHSLTIEKSLGIEHGFSFANHYLSSFGYGHKFIAIDSIEAMLEDHDKNIFQNNSIKAHNMNDVIFALEQSTNADPGANRLWILLAQAKIKVGDQVGAVEAGTRALATAKTQEESDKANTFLEEVFKADTDSKMTDDNEAIVKEPVEEPLYENLEDEISKLRRERDELISKLETFQNTVQPMNAGKQSDNDIASGALNSQSSYDNADQTKLNEADMGKGLEDSAYISSESDDIAASIEESSNSDEDEQKINHDDFVVDSTSIEVEDVTPTTETSIDGTIDMNDDNFVEGTSSPVEETNSTESVDVENIVKDDKSVNVEEIEETTTELVPESVDEIMALEDENESSDEPEIYLDIELPLLFSPDELSVEEVSSTALSYMKMADAYLQKDNLKLASKQFLKVLKKSPNHLPAILGYASSLERIGNPRQMMDVVTAYVNATKVALVQDNKNLADATLKRAVSASRGIDGDRIEALNHIAEMAFSVENAADIHFGIGFEFLTIDNLEKAQYHFMLSNTFLQSNNKIHARSTLQLGKLILSENTSKAMKLIEMALEGGDIGEMKSEAHLLLAEALSSLGQDEEAIKNLKEGLKINGAPPSILAATHYQLSILLDRTGIDSDNKEVHMTTALNLGHDLSDEAIEILGEHHIAVIKSAHRAEWKKYQEALSKEEQRGGIMSGGAVSSSSASIFSSPTDPQSDSDGNVLSMIEEGAVAYDGTVPMGDENENSNIRTSSTGQKANS